MSKLVFAEMSKDNPDDVDKAVEFFRGYVKEWLDVGYRYFIGYLDGQPVVGATCDGSYNEIDMETNELLVEVVEAYVAMLGALEQLAIAAGSASIRTSTDAIEGRPDFIAACLAQGFIGDCVQMVKVLDQSKYDAELAKVRLDLVNAELSAEVVE